MPIDFRNGTLVVQFSYNRVLVDRVRALPERAWNKDLRIWTAPVEHLPLVMEALPDLPVTEAARDAYQRLQNTLAASRSSDASAEVIVPGGTLRPYQVAAVRYIEAKKGRVLNADQMGLGKSLESLAYIHRHEDELLPLVVVCPASVKEQWKREAARWLGWSENSILVIYGRAPFILPKIKMYILNYELLDMWTSCLKSASVKSLIADESHLLKNKGAKRSMMVHSLARGLLCVMALTGTPVLNRPEELWNQVRLVRPDVFPSEWRFKERYAGFHKGRFGWEAGEPAHLEDLETRLRANLMIRREKSEVLDELPELQRITVPLGVDLAEYRKVAGPAVERLRRARKNGTLSGMSIQDITQLRQEATIAKLEPAKAWIREFLATSNRLVVFGHHHFALDNLATEFGVPALDGRVSSIKRQEAIDTFQAGEGQLLICGTRAMGQGINLQSVSYCAFLELDWNMAMHEQAESRLHRMGQENAVTAYYLTALRTIDEPMMGMLAVKQEVVERSMGVDEPTPKVLEILVDLLLEGAEST